MQRQSEEALNNNNKKPSAAPANAFSARGRRDPSARRRLHPRFPLAAAAAALASLAANGRAGPTSARATRESGAAPAPVQSRPPDRTLALLRLQLQTATAAPAAAMEKQEPQPDSLATVAVKPDYPPSEVYGSEPPPAYQKIRSNSVQIARIAAVALVAMSVILGVFILAAAYVSATASCQSMHHVSTQCLLKCASMSDITRQSETNKEAVQIQQLVRFPMRNKITDVNEERLEQISVRTTTIALRTGRVQTQPERAPPRPPPPPFSLPAPGRGRPCSAGVAGGAAPLCAAFSARRPPRPRRRRFPFALGPCDRLLPLARADLGLEAGTPPPRPRPPFAKPAGGFLGPSRPVESILTFLGHPRWDASFG
ncbi:Uncharacterized protein GBIM_05976 [Gryllus bimaculatus]|nr:Uncharacterized protein GBIM_05976 [Gryllus bimaculatus]